MNLIRKILPVLFFLTAIYPHHSQAQQDSISINTLVERTQKLLEGYPIEKIHLHFDKPYYAIGDTLWFKTYLSSNTYAYELSKVAYVEVLNDRDSLMQTLRVPLVNHVGTGHLVLDPQWYSQNNYRFRAYTLWMANTDPAYFFNKIVPVGDVINNKLHTTITFNDQGNTKGGTQAIIQFSDNSGRPIAKKRVNWHAANGYEPIDNGRGETDVMGNLTININAKDREKIKSGRLHFSIVAEGSSTPLIGSFPLNASIWDADLQFFPEGGDFIAGLPKKVAFKAIGSDGLGLKLQGNIVDQNNNTVGELSDTHLGMGVFTLLPIAGNTYTANVTFENGTQRSYPLPEVEDEGINVAVVSANGDHLQVAIVSNDAYFEKNTNKPFYLIAQSNGILCYAAQAVLKNSSVIINLPKDRFPLGVAQLTLFRADGVPVSERLTFVNGYRPVDIELSSDKKTYGTKEPVSITLNTKNNEEITPGTYSISVTDESKVPYEEDDEITILSNLLLTSDLKGFIEKPNYYFNGKNEERLKALDILLMTQGYRRFSYEDIVAERYPEVFFLPEQGIQLSGTLRLNTGKPVENGGLLLSIPDKTFRKDTYTDQNGRFVFEQLNFTDSSRVTINARGNDNYRNMVINMDQSQFPAIDPNLHASNAKLNIDEALAPYLANSRNEFRTSILIEEVEVVARATPRVSHKNYPALSGLSMADHTIAGDRLKGCNVLLMCLQTVLTGITYDAQTQLFFITRDYNAGGRIPVQFFINGMPVDVQALNGIMPAEVEGIEVFLRDELGVVSRTHQNNGVISIYTKTDHKPTKRMSLSEIEALMPKSNVVDLTPLGYVKERTFYAPKYDTPERRATNDIRPTVYWNPDITTDESGAATINFYNGDGRGTYRVIVEGLDQEGNVGRSVYRYTVQ